MPRAPRRRRRRGGGGWRRQIRSKGIFKAQLLQLQAKLTHTRAFRWSQGLQQ